MDTEKSKTEMSEREGTLMRNVNIIVTVDIYGGIEVQSAFPWRNDTTILKERDERFDVITKGGVLVMSEYMYNTFDHSSDEPLFPDRTTYVISAATSLPGAIPVAALNTAVELEENEKPIFIVGDDKLHTEAMAYTDKIFMTIINKDYHCDRFFPVAALDKTFLIAAGEKTDNLFFMVYERRVQRV